MSRMDSAAAGHVASMPMMPAKVRAVQRFAKSYFGHTNRNSALDKQLFRAASSRVKSARIDVSEKVSVSKDGQVELTPKQSMLKSSAAVEASRELQKDKSLLNSLSRHGTEPVPQEKSYGGANAALHSRSREVFGSLTDSDARVWKPPRVDFGNLA